MRRAAAIVAIVACVGCYRDATASRLAACRAEAVLAVEAGASVAEGRVVYESCKASWGL